MFRSQLKEAYDRLNQRVQSFRAVSKRAVIRIQNARRDALSVTLQAAK